uniref:TGF-beta family profile domain-containing protein n=1 Tax=Ciona savignyi TaxID=51511 RepID=H2ZM32_CIOSA
MVAVGNSVHIALILTLCVTAQVICQSLSAKEELLLIKCLNTQTSLTIHRGDGNRLKSRRCIRYLSDLEAVQARADRVGARDSVQQETSLFSYISALSNWRNQEGTLGEMLLNRAASCHQHSKRLYHYWTKFFGTRLSTATVALRVLNRTWDVMNGNTLVWPPSTRFPPNDLVAAELVIVRRKAAETGERLGKYKTLVTMREAGERARILNAGYQSSCPHVDRKFIMLDLDTRHLSNWLAHNASRLLIFSQVVPRTRYLGTETLVPVDVVHNVAGLVLHFRRRFTEPGNYRMQATARLREAARANTTFSTPAQARQRRSVPIRPGRPNRPHRHSTIYRNRTRRRKVQPACQLVPFIVPRHITTNLNVTWPQNGKRFWNISKCEGRCKSPIPHHVSKTNHAIVLNSYSSDAVCCVPIRYRTMDYITRSNGELRTDELEELVALECGCR